MLRNLTHDLLSLTSIESGKLARQMEQVNLRLILTDIITFMENEAKSKQVTIQTELPDELPFITGDKNTLTYLFTNLVSNAIKYNKPDGSITIQAAIEDNHIVISVSDTGVGISGDDQKHIFDEFFRSKNEAIKKIPGTGLGLNITKRIAELHNGHITVKSKLGEGSQFDVHLPYTKH
jgi:signal transduction histidine kinase